MKRSSVRSAGLAILLTVNSCASLTSSGIGTSQPGLSVAEAALQGGSAQIALQVSEGVLRQSPKNTQALEIKGDALTLLGGYDEAGAIFEALLVRDPGSIRATIGLGRVKLAKDPAAAEALFQSVLKQEPKNLTALNNLGIARDLLTRHAEAQTAYRVALAIDPALDSARVNLALSLAMSGKGPEAIRMLAPEASQPGASVKVRHDYAAVLAMAGRRAEAEQILSESMTPEEVHQVLDNVTGTHTKFVRAEAQSTRVADEVIPPDVVQVPETQARPVAALPGGAMPGGAMPYGRTDGAPSSSASMVAAATPPGVIRPQQAVDQGADPSSSPPVTPVGAAVAYQRPLALPLHAADAAPTDGQADSGTAPTESASTRVMAATMTSEVPAETKDPAIATPKVVAMPASRQIQSAPIQSAPVGSSPARSSTVQPPTAQPVRMAAADVVPAPLPLAPPPAPVMAPVPVPVSLSHPLSHRAERPAPKTAATSAEPASAPAGPVSSPEGSAPAASPAPVSPSSASAPATLPSLLSAAIAAPSVPSAPSASAPSASAPLASAPLASTPPPPPQPALADTASRQTDAGGPAVPAAAPAKEAARTAAPPAATPNGGGKEAAAAPAAQSEGATPAVQFAATTSEQSAYSFWQRLVQRFPDVLGQRAPTVLRFERAGMVFWRVRTEGFDTASEAQTLCVRIRAGGQECFVPRS